MLRETAILVSSGIVLYIWLSAVCAPLLSAIMTIGRDPLDARAWRAAGLAAATAVLWTAVAAASLQLLAMLAPLTALAIVESPVRDAALVAGTAVWIVRSAWVGMPRLWTDVEIASALAVVSLVRDDLETLRSVEALYRERVLAASDANARRVGIGVAAV